MAKPRSHLTLAVTIGIAYALFGVFVMRVNPEHAILGSILVIFAHMLPNMDGGGADRFPKEFGGFLAALAPLIAMEMFPVIKSGGIARIFVFFWCSYLLVKWVMARILEKWTKPRGLFHSVPAALLTTELTYLFFWDLPMTSRIFATIGALVGFSSHLLLDASTNLDFIGNKERKPPVLKLVAKSWETTCALYISVVFLGWLVMKDIYPQLRIYGGVTF
jgi:hypothetical protein